MSIPFCSTINVTVFSLNSGKEINNLWGPKEGGPEGTGKGKVQSKPVPKRGTKVLRQKPEGARDPRHGSFFFWTRGGRPRPPRKSPHGGPLAGPQRANTRQHPGP